MTGSLRAYLERGDTAACRRTKLHERTNVPLISVQTGKQDIATVLLI